MGKVTFEECIIINMYNSNDHLKHDSCLKHICEGLKDELMASGEEYGSSNLVKYLTFKLMEENLF